MFCSFALSFFCVSLLRLQSRESPLQAPSLIACEDPQLDVIMDVRRNAAPLPRHKRKLSTGFRCAAAAAARLLVIRADPPGKRMRATLQTWGKTEFQRSRRRLPSLFVLGSIHALDVLNPAQSQPPPLPPPPPICESMTRARSNAAVAAARRAQRGSGAQMLGRLERHIFFATTVGLVVGRTCVLVSTASAS